MVSGLIVIWFVCGLIAAPINKGRGHSAFVGFLAGLFFGPLGIIMTLLTIPKTVKSDEEKQCSDCAEFVWGE
ncbi:MAG: hypothetical protein MI924_00235, partial [Chloroflexales bacterium]|nr:hypothetical protein [Chloroflexales bacterium]